MARSKRKDIDYFPFIVKDGKTLFILESKYQCKGTGFFTNVMRFLSRTDDHYISIEDETDKMYFFSKVKCDEESGIDMLNIMSTTGKIDKELWDKNVIASEDFLKHAEDAYKKRVNKIITLNEIKSRFGVQSVPGNQEKEPRNTPDDEKSVQSVGGYTQSKVKNSKEDNSIVNESIIFSEFKFICLFITISVIFLPNDLQLEK